MNFLALNDILEEISRFVNQCLGPLGDGGTTSDAFIGYARDFIIQLIATCIIVVLIRIFIWKPITEMLEKRAETIDKNLEEATKAKENALALEVDLKNKLNSAQNEVKVLLDSAEMEANARREEIIAEAKLEAKRRIEDAKVEIEQEKKNKQHEIQTMIVDTAFAAASKILEKEVDRKKYLKLVNEIIEGGDINGR